jgi:lipid A 4'-phosphatase
MLQTRLFGVPILIWILCFAGADLMLAFPGLDLAVARLFYDTQAGFAINGLWWERLLYRSVGPVLILTVLALLFGWWRWRRLPAAGRPARGLSGQQLALLLTLLALVPGLIVNQGLKEHLGRARPVELVEFGEDKTFTPAFIPSDQEGGSFSSGHAAAAFFLVAVAAQWASVRSGWFVLALGYALVISGLRMASGGHFLSDILTSAALVWIGYWMLVAIFRRPATGQES